MSAGRWCVCPFRLPTALPRRTRPALVLSDAAAFNTPPVGHAVLAMVTSAGNPPWPLDCIIEDLLSAGLPAPSVVRCKLFTLDARLIRGVLGMLGNHDQRKLSQTLSRLWGSAA